MRPIFTAVGTYYCSAIDQFGGMEDGISDPIVDGTGRTWRLVSSELVAWMAGMLEKALTDDLVNDKELSKAILKFYRVRGMLEQEIQNHERVSAIDSENV